MNSLYINCPCIYGRKIAPTILLDVPEDAQIMQEEIFGPLMPILTVSTITTLRVTFYSEVSFKGIWPGRKPSILMK